MLSSGRSITLWCCGFIVHHMYLLLRVLLILPLFFVECMITEYHGNKTISNYNKMKYNSSFCWANFSAPLLSLIPGDNYNDYYCCPMFIFRQNQVKPVTKPRPRLLSRGSSYRYSGRTQKQIIEGCRTSFRQQPAFERFASLKESKVFSHWQLQF